MKKTLLLLFAAFLYSAVAMATTATDNADSAYSQKRYQDAIRIYESQAKEAGTSSDLFYNLGCAHYKMQDVPQAILCFERALVLDPSNHDARANLQFVREKEKIDDGTSDSYVTDLVLTSVGKLSSDTWAIYAAITFVLLLLAIAAYIFMDSILCRKIGFFGAGVLLVVFVAAMACAFYQRSVATSHTNAIVMTQSATLSTAPHTPSGKEVAYQLKGGTKVCIIDSVQTSGKPADIWFKVESPRQQPAWINATNIEKI